MNFDNLLRTYARTDLQRFHKQVHYLMREHDPLADRELTEQLIREPVRFELTPREHVAATTLYQLAIYEITSRSIWSKAYPARDIDAPDTSPGTTFDQEREIWGRREYFRTYALAYARMIGEVNLIEHYQMPESPPATDVPVADSASSAPGKVRRDLLVPVIESAQMECGNPFDTSAVWASLSQMAEAQKRPLHGITEDGIKWLDANDEVKFLTKKSLSDRLRRMKEHDKTR